LEENKLKAKTVATVLKGSYYILKMSGSLLSAWLTLGWRVGRARRSFENQLVQGGMTKEDARQISEVYSELKDQMMSTVKGAISNARKSSGNSHFSLNNAASA
jgi:hypothetical protein